MPLSPEELLRRRIANQTAWRARRMASARTPADRAVAAWDSWRRAVADLPADDADRYREALIAVLTTHVQQITQQLNGTRR